MYKGNYTHTHRCPHCRQRDGSGPKVDSVRAQRPLLSEWTHCTHSVHSGKRGVDTVRAPRPLGGSGRIRPSPSTSSRIEVDNAHALCPLCRSGHCARRTSILAHTKWTVSLHTVHFCGVDIAHAQCPLWPQHTVDVSHACCPLLQSGQIARTVSTHAQIRVDRLHAQCPLSGLWTIIRQTVHTSVRSRPPEELWASSGQLLREPHPHHHAAECGLSCNSDGPRPIVHGEAWHHATAPV